MKLFIQIPCFNEAETLPAVVADIPTQIPGIAEITLVVIDDGSTDDTLLVAERLGIDYIVRNHYRRGLAQTFQKGIEACLQLGADIIVNLDGDNQYQGKCIPALIAPLIEQSADIVIGCRNINDHTEFSGTKKLLQKIGSRIVCFFSHIDIPDTTSGFRAVNTKAAMTLSIMSMFSYTIEMLCQAKRLGLHVAWTPIETNRKTRPSRLFSSNIEYIAQQLNILVIVLLVYYPLPFLTTAAVGLASIMVAVRLCCASIGCASPDVIGLVYAGLAISALLFIAGLIASVLSRINLLAVQIRSAVLGMSIGEPNARITLDIVKSPPQHHWRNHTQRKEP